jgi:hypothetical protein
MPLLPRRKRNLAAMPPPDDVPAAPEPADPARCTAPTLRTGRCKLPAAPGSDRCLIHRDKPVPTTPAAA